MEVNDRAWLDETRTERTGRDADRAMAFERGRWGEEPPDQGWDEELRGYYDEGRQFGRRERRSERRDQLASSPAVTQGAGMVNDGAGFLLGLIVWAVVLNYLQGGGDQVRGWMRAKFLNEPYTPTGRPLGGAPSPPAQAVPVYRGRTGGGS